MIWWNNLPNIMAPQKCDALCFARKVTVRYFSLPSLSISCKLYRGLQFPWLCCGYYSSEQPTPLGYLLWVFLSHPHALPSVLRDEKTYPQPVCRGQKDSCTVCRLSADLCKVPCGVAWYIVSAAVPIRQCTVVFPPATSGREYNSRLAVHTKDRSFHHK